MTAAIEIAPGVTRSLVARRAVYEGTADALIAAGLVTMSMLPGQPGNARGMCCYDADGTQRQRGPKAVEPGHKQIVAKKCSAGLVYEVRVLLSPDRLEAIEAERVRLTLCWPFPVVGDTFASLSSGASARLPRQAAGVRAGESRRRGGGFAGMDLREVRA